MKFVTELRQFRCNEYGTKWCFIKQVTKIPELTLFENNKRIINDCERNGREYGTIRELSHWSIQQGAQRRVE